MPARTGPVSVFIDSEGPEVKKSRIATVDARNAASAEAIYDLGTELLSVEDRLAEQLADQLRDQLASVTAKTHAIGELNSALVDVRAAITANADTLSAGTRSTLTSCDIDVPQPVTVAELKNILTPIANKIEATGGDQRSEMVRTQLLLTNFTRATGTATSSLKRIDDHITAIVRNL